MESFLAPEQTLREHSQCLYRETSAGGVAGGGAGGGAGGRVVLGPGIFRRLQHPVFSR